MIFWTENDLTITGPNIRKMLGAICSMDTTDQNIRILDFNRIIHYPMEYLVRDLRNRVYQDQFFAIDPQAPDGKAKMDALAAEYGTRSGAGWLMNGYNSEGYIWCQHNWGTKYNAMCPILKLQYGVSENEPIQALIEFDTAFHPPVPVISKLAERYPANGFSLHYYQGWLDICGQVQWDHGAEKYHDQGAYGGPRGGKKPPVSGLYLYFPSF